jgi:SPX domain protein involved in polyphosphate accumulation
MKALLKPGADGKCLAKE